MRCRLFHHKWFSRRTLDAAMRPFRGPFCTTCGISSKRPRDDCSINPKLGYSNNGCIIKFMHKNSLYATFENALVTARLEGAFTQSHVASRLGKPQSYVSKYESGERRLDVIEFLEVCKVLNVKPDSIIEKLGGIFDY